MAFSSWMFEQMFPPMILYFLKPGPKNTESNLTPDPVSSSELCNGIFPATEGNVYCSDFKKAGRGFHYLHSLQWMTPFHSMEPTSPHTNAHKFEILQQPSWTSCSCVCGRYSLICYFFCYHSAIILESYILDHYVLFYQSILFLNNPVRIYSEIQLLSVLWWTTMTHPGGH